jgi:alpha-glucosidase
MIGRILGFLVAAGVALAAERPLELAIAADEYWWGGLSVHGPRMPYHATTRLAHNLHGDDGTNQAQPLLISNRGRYVWSEKPFRYEFGAGKLRITEAHGRIEHGTAGGTLRDAFRHVSQRFFPPDGRIPDPVMFTHPQYNTWIELMYDQNQNDILKYARAIRAQQYPPGVLMIDDNWQENYGNWQFSARRFANPAAMMEELRGLGFKLMLWVCPFVSPDSEIFRELEKRGLLLAEPGPAVAPGPDMEPVRSAAMIRWWNGVSACLDLTHPGAQAWFRAQLDRLVKDYGVGGFKLDAGDAEFYTGKIVSHAPALPNDHTEMFGRVGLDFPLNEYRASWKNAGKPLAQRLRDKSHTWEDLRTLVPGILAQGLMGYAFTCPDMIGGGQFTSFLPGAKIDEELIVRSTQVHALMPMMQFSVAPWRILSRENNDICRRMAGLHVQQSEAILRIARESARTGEPIVRPLCWQWPDGGYESITDQFMLGDDILVAPVLQKGARTRRVVFPPGTWRGDDARVVTGPATTDVDAPLERLPWFRREE